jgi:aspartyl-tRNA(Asn)/glutamyl-tRNA(Gln) amidotransferase subunit A
MRQAVEQAVATLTDLGVEVEEVSLPHLNHSLACYFIIASAEASSQLARFDGVRYGHRTTRPTADIYDMFAQSRAEGFGPEVQLRIVAGTWMLSAEHFEAYFEKSDAGTHPHQKRFPAGLAAV